jgi:hypothetical protein
MDEAKVWIRGATADDARGEETGVAPKSQIFFDQQGELVSSESACTASSRQSTTSGGLQSFDLIPGEGFYAHLARRQERQDRETVTTTSGLSLVQIGTRKSLGGSTMDMSSNIGKGFIYGIVLLALMLGSAVRAEPLNAIAGRMGVTSKAMVAACNAESALAGEQILKQGGSAVDPFVPPL